MQLTARYFATSPGFCALCGASSLDLGWWLQAFPSCRVPAFEPDFLYALSDGRWVCGDCALEMDPAFCHAQAILDADNHIARLDAWGRLAVIPGTSVAGTAVHPGRRAEAVP